MATPSESGADGDRIGTKRCSSTQGETEIHASLERSDSIAVGKRLSHTYTHTHTETEMALNGKDNVILLDSRERSET